MTIEQARRLQILSRWHRRIAVVVVTWLAFLAGTGILINHAGDWGLDRKPLASSLQRWVYGIEVNGVDYCSEFPDAGSECGGIFAGLDLSGGSLLLGEHSLFLLDPSGGLVEKISVLQAGLESLEGGLAEGGSVYLRGGGLTVQTGPELLEFRALETNEAEALNAAAWQKRQEPVESISWERLFLDLHAARFLGPFAKAFNDIAAGLILLLAVTGGWLHRLKSRAKSG